MTQMKRMTFHMQVSTMTGTPVAETIQHAVELTKKVMPLMQEIATSVPEANLLFAFMYLLHVGGTAEADENDNVSVMPEAHELLEVAGALLVDWETIVKGK